LPAAPLNSGQYLTFVVSLQATLVWLLVVTVPHEEDTKAES
jgi:hypothetical protein